MTSEETQARIDEFKQRFGEEKEWCENLYRYSTIRLLAHKYAYYVLSKQIVPDYSYDIEEKGWYIMGRALGHLKEDETSPCVDFDEKHPLAEEGKEMALRLVK